MHYKKLLTVLGLIASCILLVNFTYIKVSGAHPGTTGAPGDATCVQSGCHTGTVITNDKLVNSLIFPTPDSTYEPGKTYTVKINVKNPGIARFGFEVLALEDKGNKNIGTFTLTQTTRTQILKHTVNGDLRAEVSHLKAGTPATPSTGLNSWEFNWTAPSTNVGTITFYYATNSTNNDGLSSGDNIRTSTFKLKPAVSSGINEFFNEQEITAFYNQNGNFIDLKYNLKKDGMVSLTILNTAGQQIHSSTAEQKNAGQITEKIELPANVAAGIYYINLQCGAVYQTKKIIVR